MSSHVICYEASASQQSLRQEFLNEFNSISSISDYIPPIFNKAAGGIKKAIKASRKGWAVVRWVFNDPSACRIRGDSNNKVLTRQRRRWRQMRENARNTLKLQ